ncbi:hypothetical protein [Streptomyces sp. SID161]|uniref:hypothetical protein n=1 Tax=Streptomyces sp. SID161 TaxID=2690251 RepID=UPI0013696BB8|nr:hypothetical protein [Streptomyces sp. SID161]MYW48837.1 hypothetical protein [Streptomyces sp. SID161]MYW49878.1 hypothetical protein [Streptomyces sp. SID161]
MIKPFGALAAVHAFVVRLATTHPQLPGPSISTHPYDTAELSLCLHSPSAVEAWRAALHVSHEAVNFKPHVSDQLLIDFTADVEGFQVRAFALFESAELAEAIKKVAAQQEEALA